jgi:hypothetical protein
MYKKGIIKDCILNNVEKRWLDSWNLWISCAKDYFVPESFRLNLNNCIQTLRSITWILQKTKSDIPEFNKWYEAWQSKMRSDQILKWLNDSRNRIVKEGDLILFSKAKIAIVTSWLEPPSIEIEIHPFTKTSDFVKVITERISPKPSYLDAILKVERKWVDSKLPKTELLEALAHTFYFLTKILLDALESLLKDKYIEKCSWYHVYNSQKNQIHGGMNSFDWYRTSWFDLKNNEFVDIKENIINKNLLSLKKAKERYSECLSIIRKFKDAKNLNEEAKTFFEMAKSVLKRDGYHSPITIIGYPDGSKRIYALEFKDKSEKYLSTYKLANILKSTGAISLILITESWLYPESNVKYTNRGFESPDKKEALSVSALNSKGDEYHYAVIFEKVDNKIIIKEESQDKFSNLNDFLFLPIKKTWGIK